MSLAILILINVALWAIFYLVISLKLEKSASEFREKKLHDEMNKIIKEFNITADRNISLLENRIKVLQNLLKQKGNISSIDITVDDEESKLKTGHADDTPEISDSEKEEKDNEIMHHRSYDLARIPVRRVEKASFSGRIKQVISSIFKVPAKIEKEYSLEDEDHPLFTNERLFQQSFKTPSSVDRKEFVIEKEYEENAYVSDPDLQKAVDNSPLNNEDIENLIKEDMDVYEVINLLHENGLQVNEIAHYVGLPEGEIKLVLNLNSSR